VAKPQIDAAQLQDRLEQHFGTIVALEPLVEGEDSRAFAFVSRNDRLVVRINRDSAGFHKDRLAHQRFAGSDLPVPEVLLIAPFGTGFLCVSRRLPGETVQHLPQGAAYAYGPAVMRLLDTLAQRDLSDTPGYGPLGPDGRAPFPHWRDFVTDVAAWDWSSLPSAMQDDVALFTAEAVRVGGTLADVGQLVHGDFGSNNVLVADGGITGLIDWSEAMAGDARYDLANILFWRPWLDCMEQQCRYIETHMPERLADLEILTCYQLRIGLETLRDAVEAGDIAFANWVVNRCAAIRS
jgi:hygromycin-B 4-O-kinase